MITAIDLAREFGVDPKRFRAWLRSRYSHERNARWVFTAEEAEEVRRAWRAHCGSSGARAPSVAQGRTAGRGESDEAYVIELVEDILSERALRQHRFTWLRGDPGPDGRRATLPVDAYFPKAELVVEYRERQHDEAVEFFDKPGKMTVSNVHRGEQRRIYDERREIEIPRHGLRLVIVSCKQLSVDRRGRLLRNRHEDKSVLERLLREA